MAEPYLGEIRMVGFTFAPRQWALCDGEILPINQNQSLYSILGTTYGGDGRTSFALPDLRGRTPIHAGSGTGLTARTLGEKGGEEGHVLTVSEVPPHRHAVNATSVDADTNNPTGALLGGATFPIYGSFDDTTKTTLNSLAVASTGKDTEVNNMQPFLAVNFIIALTGTFPPRN